MTFRGSCLVVVATGLLATVVIGAPPPLPQPTPPLPPPPPVALSAAHADANQIVLQGGDNADNDLRIESPLRKLHGRFLHITDLHPDEFYKPHTSTEESFACHRGKGPAGAYGAETSDCDSPFSLVNATLEWVGANLKDSIDFVVWTGDSARHDSDSYHAPRHNSEIIRTNRIIADRFVDTFSDSKGLTIPVVPTFGNNDIYPHNVLMPGPNDILRTYTDIWKPFIPEEQRHSFEFGGWFYVEVIPKKLAVFSLNTLYFFDRNAGVDDCASPSEPGYKHFEWLRIQLQFLRDRGMKAILMGHVPPARTEGKQLWDETCWQKYTFWLQQYRDVVVGSLYGHMNIDHFILQDTSDIDIALIDPAAEKANNTRESMGSELSAQSRTDYLVELREEWSQLPDPVLYADGEVEIEGEKKKKKKKKGKKKIGGPWAERYQLSLVSPSVVPNYFPSIRVFEYNITGLENTATWVDTVRALGANSIVHPDLEGIDRQEAISDPDISIDGKKKKKGKKGKGGKGKKPDDPNLHVPDGPSSTAPPGPAYSPQPLTFTGFTQYYANLTYINNDFTKAKRVDGMKWDSGKHSDKKPKSEKPKPKEFGFEVEYNTFEDKIYKLKDLTVRSFVQLGHRIGQDYPKSARYLDDFEDDDDDIEQDQLDAQDIDDPEDELEEDGDSSDDNDDDDGIDATKKKKKKKGKKKHKGGKKKHGKTNKAWFHFLKHAFVSTSTEEELKDML